jgi:DNA (cytosine-5)-methyltransferase 1
MNGKVLLSLFPGIGLLDRGFEDEGYCVVRGPDLLWGGDIKKFFPPPGVFWGIIAGSPCQDFSRARRDPPTGYGLEMLEEFTRCVTAAQPEWWLLENVDRVPDVTVPGYSWQRLDMELAWYTNVRRLRHIQFGSRSGFLLDASRETVCSRASQAALANDDRPWRDLAQLQGLPDDWDLPGFTVKAKKAAIGNGVPYLMARKLARVVTESVTCRSVTQSVILPELVTVKRCACGCGRQVTGKRSKRYYDYSCRKRAQRKRDRTGHNNATELGHTIST